MPRIDGSAGLTELSTENVGAGISSAATAIPVTARIVSMANNERTILMCFANPITPPFVLSLLTKAGTIAKKGRGTDDRMILRKGGSGGAVVDLRFAHQQSVEDQNGNSEQRETGNRSEYGRGRCD